MISFRYRASNLDGDTVGGTIAALSERLALRELRSRGLTALALARESAPPRAHPGRSRRAGTADYILLLKQIALMLEAGVTLDEILRGIIEAAAYRPLRAGLEAMRRDLRQGSPFAAALRRALPELPMYVFPLVEAGELSGQLRQAIADAAEQMSQQHRLSRDIRNALIYPAVLTAAGTGAVLFVFTFVVPRFAAMFKDRMDSLPWLSRMVMGMGRFFDEHMLLIGAGVTIAALALHRLARRPAAQAALHRLGLGAPVVGLWLAEVETGRCVRLLATLLAHKVPLIQSMTLARDAVRGDRLKSSLAQVERAVRGGSTLAKALADYTAFDATTINLVSVGERTGNLAGMLASAAAFSAENSRDRLKRLVALIEPAAILVIGTVVGTIVVGVFLAVASISNVPL